jgi:selenocysteine lyase/cysteine desulfurase
MTRQTIDPVEAFPILREWVFFNHAGVAPLSGPAAAAMREFVEQSQRSVYVGSNWYRRAREVKANIARLINAQGPQEIAYMPNTSSGLATVARGFEWHDNTAVVTTEVEYPANRFCWQDLKRFGTHVIEVPQQPDGRIDVEDVIESITNDTRIVAISHVQFGSGYRIDLRPIADTVHLAGGFLCVDGIQSVGAMPVDVEAMGIDFLALDGHKWLLGPEGAGFLYIREDLIPMLHPPVVGWMNMVNSDDYNNSRFQLHEDSRRFEPGSYNIAGVLALGASVQMMLDLGMQQVWDRIDALTSRLCAGVESRGYRVFSPRQPGERSGIVSFHPANPDKRGKADLLKIVSDLEAKKIVIAMRDGRLRASPHFYNTDEQVDRLVAELPDGN